MLNKDLFSKKMDELNIVFSKKPNNEYYELIYGKLNAVGLTDVDMMIVFDRLFELEKYPRFGKIVKVYREIRSKPPNKNRPLWYVFTCPCGSSFVLELADLLGDPNLKIPCPGLKLESCDRRFSRHSLRSMAIGKPEGAEINIPADQGH